MMRRGLIVLAACVVAACGTTPLPPLALRLADESADSARRAADEGMWQAARLRWHEAAQRYAVLDDWLHAGMSSLGESQAMMALHDPAASEVMVRAVCDGERYPAPVKAEAHYQWALIAAGQQQAALAGEQLQRAEALAAGDAPLLAAIWNAEARLAADRHDWQQVLGLAAKAKAAAGAESGEVANAHRLIGEADLHLAQEAAGRAALETALQMDRALGRPDAVLHDLTILAGAAAKWHWADAALWQERAEAACRAHLQASKAGCTPDPARWDR